MKRGVIWTWGAEADSQNIFSQAEELSAGSGNSLIQKIDQVLGFLCDFPFAAPVFVVPIRRAGIRRTPYALFYVVESGRLVVIALQDTRRDPASLRQELLNRLPR